MHVKSIVEWEHSAILSTFIKVSFVIKIFVLSVFDWPFYTGFTLPYFKQFLISALSASGRCVCASTWDVCSYMHHIVKQRRPKRVCVNL